MFNKTPSNPANPSRSVRSTDKDVPAAAGAREPSLVSTFHRGGERLRLIDTTLTVADIPRLLGCLSEEMVQINFRPRGTTQELTTEQVLRTCLIKGNNKSPQEIVGNLSKQGPGILPGGPFPENHRLKVTVIVRSLPSNRNICSNYTLSSDEVNEFRGRAVHALCQKVAYGIGVVFSFSERQNQAQIARVLHEAAGTHPDLQTALANSLAWERAHDNLGRVTHIRMDELLAKAGPLAAKLSSSPAVMQATASNAWKAQPQAIILQMIPNAEPIVTNEAEAKASTTPDEQKSPVSLSQTAATPPVPAKQESVAVQHRKWFSSKLSEKLPTYQPSVLSGLPKAFKSFYASRALPDITWPGEESRLIKISDTEAVPYEIKKGDAAGILELCRNRTFAETARMLFGAQEKLAEAMQQKEEAGLSRQNGFMVRLPSEGTALFFSDLEGGVTRLAMLMDEYKLVERWKNNEKIFLCILGDSVDRSPTGSLLIDFLLELKCNQGFERQVIILPGNHEIDPSQNFKEADCWQAAECSLIGDIFARAFNQPAAADAATPAHADRATLTQLVELCPKAFPPLPPNPNSADELWYRARGGLYALYHSIFNLLPRCIVSERGLYAAHAGFPTYGPFEKFFQEEKADDSAPRIVDALAWDAFTPFDSDHWCSSVLWADFRPQLFSNDAFVPFSDPRRTDPASGRSLVTLDDFNRFAGAIGATLMVRGHQENAPDGATFPEDWTKIKSMLDDQKIHTACHAPWVAGNVATVQKASWAAALNLAIDKPSPADLTWIGAIPTGVEKHKSVHGRSLPGADLNILLWLPPLGSSPSKKPESPEAVEAECSSASPESDAQPDSNLRLAAEGIGKDVDGLEALTLPPVVMPVEKSANKKSDSKSGSRAAPKKSSPVRTQNGSSRDQPPPK